MKTTAAALLLLLAACSGDDASHGDGSGDVLDETVYASFWYDNPCVTFADCDEMDCTAREIGATLHVSMREATDYGWFAGWMNRFCDDVRYIEQAHEDGFTDDTLCCAPGTLLTRTRVGCEAEGWRAPAADELEQGWCWPEP